MAQLKEQHVDVMDDEPLFQSRSVEDSEMDITPMIDITFLLLIFFIVASKMNEDTPVTLPKAKHGTAVAIKESAIITLGESDAEQAFVYKGDGKNDETVISSSDPDTQEEEIVAYLEEQLGGTKSFVIIKAEKNVKHGDVARVSRAVGKVRVEAARSIYVAVVELQ